MKLKEIKPRMVIHCNNDEEKRKLLEEAERLGYRWISGGNKPTDKSICSGTTIHFHDDNTIAWSNDTRIVTEFSDLIIPEMSAEEALHIFGDICGNVGCSRCPFDSIKGDSDCPTFLLEHYKEAAEICQQWKSDHEKKEPEIETVDVCRIIEVLPDGKKRCVHEENIKPDTDLPYGGEQIAVEETLKRYCMEHDGVFIAVHETVSRVKR